MAIQSFQRYNEVSCSKHSTVHEGFFTPQDQTTSSESVALVLPKLLRSYSSLLVSSALLVTRCQGGSLVLACFSDLSWIAQRPWAEAIGALNFGGIKVDACYHKGNSISLRLCILRLAPRPRSSIGQPSREWFLRFWVRKVSNTFFFGPQVEISCQLLYSGKSGEPFGIHTLPWHLCSHVLLIANASKASNKLILYDVESSRWEDQAWINIKGILETTLAKYFDHWTWHLYRLLDSKEPESALW